MEEIRVKVLGGIQQEDARLYESMKIPVQTLSRLGAT